MNFILKMVQAFS